MWLTLALVALAQDYRLPLADEHAQYAYPTAYFDHAGQDWSCGDLQYSGHRGTDIGIGSWAGMDAGRDIVAAAAGVVTVAYDGDDDHCTTGTCGSNTSGNHVRVTHADGKRTHYGHMKKGSVAVVVGQTVECGEHLGQVGSSGWSTGPHLHFGVWRNDIGAWVDPFEGDCAAPPSYWVDQGAYEALPATTCEDPPTCIPAATLGCGSHYEGAGTGTDTHAYWGECAEWAEYTGPEVALTLDTEPGTVLVTLSGLGADLDLFLLESSRCAALDCLAASTTGSTASEQVGFVSDGTPRTLVVDGFREASSAFVLDVACGVDLPDTGDTGDTGAPDTGDTDPPDTDPPMSRDDTGQGDTGAPDTDVPDAPGCGCNTLSSPPLASLLGLAFLARRRRHRA